MRTLNGRGNPGETRPQPRAKAPAPRPPARPAAPPTAPAFGPRQAPMVSGPGAMPGQPLSFGPPQMPQMPQFGPGAQPHPGAFWPPAGAGMPQGGQQPAAPGGPMFGGPVPGAGGMQQDGMQTNGFFSGLANAARGYFGESTGDYARRINNGARGGGTLRSAAPPQAPPPMFGGPLPGAGMGMPQQGGMQTQGIFGDAADALRGWFGESTGDYARRINNGSRGGGRI